MIRSQGLRVIEIDPPLGGIDKRGPLQSQPPFTSVASTNFWPIDLETKRQVLSVRPALVPILIQPGGTGIVNMVGFYSNLTGTEVIAAQGGSLYVIAAGPAWTEISSGAEAGNLDTTDDVIRAVQYLDRVYITNPHSTDSGATGKLFVYNPAADTLTLISESAGTCPAGLALLTAWQGCLVGAGGTLGHVLYMSRTGDPTDWDFSAPFEDEGGAFFTSSENAGVFLGLIQAIIPFTDDILLVATANNIMMYNGHPRRGGVATEFAKIQLCGPDSWCKGPRGELYLLCEEGLYRVDPSANPVAIPLSQSKIPDDLLNLRPDLVGGGAGVLWSKGPTLAYEERWNVVVISNGLPPTDDVSYIYDLNLQPGGFHQQTFASGRYPKLASQIGITVSGVASPGLVLYVGEDDTLCSFANAHNEAENFVASVTMGPIRLGGSVREDGLVSAFSLLPGEEHPRADGSTLAIRLQTGADGADAVRRVSHTANQFRYDITVAASTNSDRAANGYRYFPQLGGNSLCIRITATGDGTDAPTFTFEGAALEVRPRGRTRNFRTFSE
jgi:hypothetical protein